MVPGESMSIDTESESMRERMKALMISIPDKAAPTVRGEISIHNSRVEHFLRSIETSEGVSEERVRELEERRVELCRQAGIDQAA